MRLWIVSQLIEDARLQILDGTLQIEVVQNDRTNHASIEMRGDELRHAVGVYRSKLPLPDPLADDLGQHSALFFVEALDRGGDVRIALVCTAEVQGDLHEAVNLGIFVDVVIEPRRDQVR